LSIFIKRKDAKTQRNTQMKNCVSTFTNRIYHCAPAPPRLTFPTRVPLCAPAPLRSIFQSRVPLSALAPLRLILFLMILLTPTLSYSQFLPVHPQNKGIYTFLEEFPLETNPSVKPLSRLQISNALTSLDTTLLTSRQQKELTFYLKHYDKETHINKNFSRRTDLF